MPTLNLDGTLYIPADGLRLSAPWRLGESPNDRALTPEQEVDIASRFELDLEVIERLSWMLSFALDPMKMPNLIPIDPSVAKKRGETIVRKARQEITKAKRQLMKQLHLLEGLTIDRESSAEANAPFPQGHASLAEGIAHLEQAEECFQETLANPGTVRLDTPTDKRKVSDQRRIIILQHLFRIWSNAGGRMTTTVDTGIYTETHGRSGELIDFINAVVTCITEPPTELSAETIAPALKNFRDREHEGLVSTCFVDNESWLGEY